MAAALAVPSVLSAGGLETLRGGAEASFAYLPARFIAADAAAAAPVPAYDAAGAVPRAAKAYYLSSDQVATDNFQSPPAAGSAEAQADLATVLQWQKNRTPAQCAAAKAQSGLSYDAFFGAVSPFPSPLPSAAAAFFKRVISDSGAADGYLKDLYQRPRPFQQNSSVNPCLGKVGGYSYPSGHATASHLLGRILADLAPQQASTFMAYADQAALNRVIGGVHFPSDIEAGKRLADSVYAKMQQNPAFAADMNAMKKLLSK